MLADAAWFLYEHRWLLAWIGANLFAAGITGIVLTWAGLILGPDPEIPEVVEPEYTTIHPDVEVEPNYRRDDDDTRVIPSIPGATRVLTDFIDAVEDVTSVLRVIEHEEEAVTDELLQRVRDGLKGPVCPTCGGPFGSCACVSQKNAPTDEQTQVVDLCPLTTQDIAIPDEGETPFHAAAVRNTATRELSAHIAAIQDKERVA